MPTKTYATITTTAPNDCCGAAFPSLSLISTSCRVNIPSPGSRFKKHDRSPARPGGLFSQSSYGQQSQWKSWSQCQEKETQCLQSLYNMPPEVGHLLPSDLTSHADGRSRRTRCDGQPRCGTCRLVDEECVYEGDQDGRRPATKQYVESLKNRIKQLESQLQAKSSGGPSEQAVSNGDGSGFHLSRSPVAMTGGPEREALSESPVASAENRLRSNTGAMKVSR